MEHTVIITPEHTVIITLLVVFKFCHFSTDLITTLKQLLYTECCSKDTNIYLVFSVSAFRTAVFNRH